MNLLRPQAVSRRRALRLAAGMGAWMAAASPAGAAAPAALDLAPQVFEEYVWSLHLPQADAVLLYLAYYREKLRAENSIAHLQSLPMREVAKAFDELYAIIFYTADQQVLLHLVKVFGLLDQRKQATQLQLQRTYKACYYCRSMDLAKQLAGQFPGRVKAAPEIRMSAGAGAGTPTVMRLASGRGELFATACPLPEKPTVLMVTNPGCHFSRDAFAAIREDPVLVRRLNGALQLLAPHQMDFDIDDFVEWNRTYPSLPMSLAYHWRGWTMLDMRETPTFYFIKAGAVKHVMKGWRDSSAKAALKNGLAQIDL
ncbi:hypothetical protein RugamoR64_63110 [Duganella rhizosphaerae]|uniref:hypothetical protein n=1 Tax=Duganella rhizosphaerae TaxID=2885763 RepID=UPI0030EA4569